MEWAFQWNRVLYFLVSTVTVHNWITVVISPDTQSIRLKFPLSLYKSELY